MAKFDVSKLKNAKWLGVVVAVGTGIAALVGSLADQENAKTVKDLAERVAQLENK